MRHRAGTIDSQFSLNNSIPPDIHSVAPRRPPCQRAETANKRSCPLGTTYDRRKLCPQGVIGPITPRIAICIVHAVALLAEAEPDTESYY